MRKILSLFLSFALLFGSAKFSYAKTESGSSDAASVVLYGSDGTNIHPLKVDSDGKLVTDNDKSDFSVTTVASDGILVNSQNINQSVALVSYNDKQYAGYWNESGNLVTCSRSLPNGAWTRYVWDGTAGMPTETVTADNHNCIALGVDQDGYLHISYDMHDVALKYRKSTTAEDVSAWGNEISMLGTNETSVTYPLFVYDNSHELYFMFRSGSSGNGDLYLYHYDDTSNAWEAANGTTAGLVIKASDATPDENPYTSAMVFDADNNGHIVWNWRETGTSTTAHDVCYAKYVPSTGKWYQSDGTEYALPITPTTGEKAVTQAQGDYGFAAFIQSRNIAATSSGKVHIVWNKYTALANGMTQAYYVSTDGSGVWTNVQFTDESVPVKYSRIFLTANDELYIVSMLYGGGLIVHHSEDEGVTWTRYHLLSEVDFTENYLRNFDYRAWQDDEEIYLMFQIAMDQTTTSTRRPMYLLHAKLGDFIFGTPAVPTRNFTSYDDITIKSSNGDVTVNAADDITLDPDDNIVLQADSGELKVELGDKIVWYAGDGSTLANIISAATAGDTIQLFPGTYDLTAVLNVSKALTIKGVGKNKTILSFIKNGALTGFNITASNVVLEDLSITQTPTAAGNQYPVLIDGTGGAMIDNVALNNINITLYDAYATATTGIAVKITDCATTTLRNVKIVATSTQYGIQGVGLVGAATSEAPQIVNMYDTHIVVSGNAATTRGTNVSNVSGASTTQMNLFDCNVFAAETAAGAATSALGASSANSTLNAYKTVANGADYDVIQGTTAVANLIGSTLVNNTISGTATLLGTYSVGGLSTGAIVSTGKISNTMTSQTLAAAAATIAITNDFIKVTGDGSGNTVATITGGISGQILKLAFVDALVTITDTAAATANTVDLSAAFTSSANDTITLIFDGNKWFEIARSVN